MSFLRDTTLGGKTGAAGEARSGRKRRSKDIDRLDVLVKPKKVKDIDRLPVLVKPKKVKLLRDYMSWKNLDDDETQ